MAILRTIEFWPSTGFPNAAWCEDAGEDAFVRSARSVCELYSEGLVQARIHSRVSSLRIFCDHDHARADVLVAVGTDPAEGFEFARATLPAGVEAMNAKTRAGLVLDVVHGAAVRLAQARAWDGTGLEVARQHTLEHDLHYVWAGPPKSSPDRRHTARAIYRLQDDGYGRVIVEVRRRPDDALVAVSGEELAFSTSEGLKRSARTLRWRGSGTVRLVPYSGLGGAESGLLSLSLSPANAAGPSPSPPESGLVKPQQSEAPAPAVVVRGKGANAPEAGPQMLLGGGGPMNNVPHAYITALDGLLDRMSTPEWLGWWSDSEDDVLEVVYWFDTRKPAIVARRGKNRLRVAIHRPVESFAAATDLVALARHDVDALLHTIRRRTGLGPHPQLPDLPGLAGQTAQQIASEDEHSRPHALLARAPERPPSRVARRQPHNYP